MIVRLIYRGVLRKLAYDRTLADCERTERFGLTVVKTEARSAKTKFWGIPRKNEWRRRVGS